MLSFFADIAPHGKGNTNHVPVSTAQSRADFERQLAEKQVREKQYEDQMAAIEAEFLAKRSDASSEGAPPVDRTDQSAATGSSRVVLLADSRERGQQWEFTTDPPAEHWFEIAFDDRSWKRGEAGFGVRGTPGSVVRTDWQGEEIWLRKDFGLMRIPTRLILTIHHDEDAEIYLNGKQIARRSGYVTDYQQLDVTAESFDVLQTGRNTLAIHCRHTRGGQYIDAGLTADFRTNSIEERLRRHGAETLGEAKWAKWQQLRQKLSESRSAPLESKTEYVMAVSERGTNQTWILGRGNPRMRGEEVVPAFPQVFSPPTVEVPEEYRNGSSSGKRRVLAEWIVSPDNPVAARVIVNRVWQHHFGRGIVRTTSDFGFQGSPPSHPQLLDWLACRLMADGWRLKPLHRLIMLSATYQMSSQSDAIALAQDPTNELFWRFNMRRLTAEEMRDSILDVSGTLNLKMFGPSIYPPLPAEVLATASRPEDAWGHSSPEEAARRTIYVHVKRSLRPPMLTNFDAPDSDTTCPVRLSTTVPTQALGMLNSRFLNEQAAKLAARLQQEYPQDVHAQVAEAIRRVTARTPEEDEIREDVTFLQELAAHQDLSLEEALQHYALLMLNTNEFVYLD